MLNCIELNWFPHIKVKSFFNGLGRKTNTRNIKEFFVNRPDQPKLSGQPLFAVVVLCIDYSCLPNLHRWRHYRCTSSAILKATQAVFTQNPRTSHQMFISYALLTIDESPLLRHDLLRFTNSVVKSLNICWFIRV